MVKKFFVGGMTCSNCATGIEKYLKKLNGINKAEVSLLSKELVVEFNEQEISEELIKASVEKLGYSISENYGFDKNSHAKKLKKRFFISLIILLPLMYLCLAKTLNLPIFEDKLNFVLQFFLALIILIINRAYFINGFKAVLNKMPNMDTLVSLGSISAFSYSVVITILTLLGKTKIHHVFFDGSAMVLCLVTLGKWLEELSKVKTGDAVEKLGSLIPKTATILVDGKEKIILTNQIAVGDKVLVRVGDYVCVDGVIIDGKASVDKSAITGESFPHETIIGGQIISGSILINGYLIIQAEKVGEDTLFSKVIELVKSAGASKAKVQKVADKVAGIFVPVVFSISILTFIIWFLTTNDLYKAINFAISVLVISCPCSLGLATPVAIMAGTGKSASNGVLFKNADGLQTACKINCVLLDKTATITVGKPKVVDFIAFNSTLSNKEIFSYVSALEQKSSHPLAKSIIEYCGKSALSVDEFEYQTGKGIVGYVYGEKYYLGNVELLPKNIKIDFESEKFNGKSLVYFANDDQLIAVYVLADYLKEDSVFAINELKKKGIKTVMLTGDNYSSALNIAEQVGIDEFYANVLPQDKYDYVEKYKKQGNFVAMVGDGINDSPALKSADVGVAIGTGTDIAIDSADVVLANGSLTGLINAIKISKKTSKIIKENLFWAFFYNSIGIPIAGGVLSFFGIVLTPIIASALMSCSSLFVVLNALRISKGNRILQAQERPKELHKTRIIIDGMMCKHCESKVKDALLSLGKVYNVFVSLEQKLATLEIDKGVKEQDIINAIEQKGFKVVSIE